MPTRSRKYTLRHFLGPFATWQFFEFVRFGQNASQIDENTEGVGSGGPHGLWEAPSVAWLALPQLPL